LPAVTVPPGINVRSFASVSAVVSGRMPRHGRTRRAHTALGYLEGHDFGIEGAGGHRSGGPLVAACGEGVAASRSMP